MARRDARRYLMNPLQQHDYQRLQSTDHLIGIDEAGRGCLAGPVVAGACVLNVAFFESAKAIELSALINDSKQLTAEAREEQYVVLEQLQADGLLDFSVASGTVEEIAALNILGATRLAMRRAVEALERRVNDWGLPVVTLDGPLFGPAASQVQLIVDGRPLKPFPYLHEGIVKGDGKSLSIAMASIAAKVIRDREMKVLADKYPEYGFEVHKGYGTKKHRDALHAHGPCPIHRELFLRKILGV